MWLLGVSPVLKTTNQPGVINLGHLEDMWASKLLEFLSQHPQSRERLSSLEKALSRKGRRIEKTRKVDGDSYTVYGCTVKRI